MFAIYETATNHVLAIYSCEDHAWAMAEVAALEYGLDYSVKRVSR